MASLRTVMLDAHMDEIGFMITHIENDGFLRFTALGGWDARLLLAHAVTIRTRDGALLRGVVGSLPPHILSAEDRDLSWTEIALVLDEDGAGPSEAALRKRFERLKVKLKELAKEEGLTPSGRSGGS